jgi:hypothetical protein
LTDPRTRHVYVAQAMRALWRCGFAIVGAFGPEGTDSSSVMARNA